MSSCLGIGGGRACHMELPLHGHICAFVETGFIRGTVRIVAQWDESSAASYAHPPFAHQMSTQHDAPMCTGAHGFGAAPTLADEEGHEDNKATGSAVRVTGAGASCVLDPVYLEELRAALTARGAWDDGAGEVGAENHTGTGADGPHGSHELGESAGRIPTSSAGEVEPFHGAAHATHGFTVQGYFVALAMLAGHKPVENRPKRLLRKGWHALHLGVGTCPYNQLAAELHPDLVRGRDYHPQSEWSGAIVGLIFVSEHRSQEQCNSHPWALGPVCHVISHTVELSRPVRHLGQQGSWRIDQGAKCEFQRQLAKTHVILRTLDVSPLGPAPSPSAGPTDRRKRFRQEDQLTGARQTRRTG